MDSLKYTRLGQLLIVGALFMAFVNPVHVDGYITCGSVLRPEAVPWYVGDTPDIDGYYREIPVRSVGVNRSCDEGLRNRAILWVVVGAVGGLLWSQGLAKQESDQI